MYNVPYLSFLSPPLRQCLRNIQSISNICRPSRKEQLHITVIVTDPIKPIIMILIVIVHSLSQFPTVEALYFTHRTPLLAVPASPILGSSIKGIIHLLRRVNLSRQHMVGRHSSIRTWRKITSHLMIVRGYADHLPTALHIDYFSLQSFNFLTLDFQYGHHVGQFGGRSGSCRRRRLHSQLSLSKV